MSSRAGLITTAGQVITMTTIRPVVVVNDDHRTACYGRPQRQRSHRTRLEHAAHIAAGSFLSQSCYTTAGYRCDIISIGVMTGRQPVTIKCYKPRLRREVFCGLPGAKELLLLLILSPMVDPC